MSLVSTKTPIFDDIPSIQFFNGRLLSGEDMTTEQAWNAARRKLLGQALGSGVAFGLEVRVSVKSEHAGKPIVSVDPGLALNADGAILSLAEPTDVSLAQIDETVPVPAEFAACQPTQYSAYVKSDGVYLLTLCPAMGTQGRAPVMGLANQEARCNRKYRREGVQFRLHQLKLIEAELADRNKLRNLVAYKCFNSDAWQAFVTDPFAAPDTKPKLLDGLLVPKLEASEVPLATIFWTTDGGIEYVDMWAVRRRITKPSVSESWSFVVGDRRRSEAEAMFLQFQAQIADLVQSGGDLGAVAARSHFRYLPAVGMIPVLEESDATDAMATKFFKDMTYRSPAFINAARLETLLRQSMDYPPIDTQGGEMVWLYRVRENRWAIDTATGSARPRSYLVFASGHVPYQADAQFDLARWNYSNYAINR
jgi:hypothetical protein